VTPAFAAARLIDEKDGTVEDTQTDLIWLQDANCFGLMNWSQALVAVSTLAHGSCGLMDGSEPGEWRLPDVKELHSLIDFGTFNPALPSGHPFSRVESAVYWTSTTYAGPPGGVWSVVLNIGHTFVALEGETNRVWPVRDNR
jgi:Protein of unknown function (DUF1566)